jgi:hypothetical protein
LWDSSGLEENLLAAMPWVVTSPAPLLTAAKTSTQVEFDRAFGSVVRSLRYLGKRGLLISGINIDISPQEGPVSTLTRSVPWAAYIQDLDGSRCTPEQHALLDALNEQSEENPDQIDLEDAIWVMGETEGAAIQFPRESMPTLAGA